jgi:large subunit ribosomal protein L21
MSSSPGSHREVWYPALFRSMLDRFHEVAMYAVIRAGGKQHKVSKGDVIEVERLDVAEGDVRFEPVLVVDDAGRVSSLPSELEDTTVTARVVGAARGPKVRVQRYRSKTGYRRHTGHRQKYTTVEISEIDVRGRSSAKEQVEGNGS